MRNEYKRTYRLLRMCRADCDFAVMFTSCEPTDGPRYAAGKAYQDRAMRDVLSIPFNQLRYVALCAQHDWC